MFTGIVEALASVQERTESTLKVELPASFDDISIGASVCVSGACLSVTQFDDSSMTFDVVTETWERTKLGSLKKDDKVNLERAMQMSDRFDGHMVQGHVEGIGIGDWNTWDLELGEQKSKSQIPNPKSHPLLVVRLPEDLIVHCIPKGSITLDGVSLTIASVKDNEITVALIPHTLENTTLGLLKEGDKVNIETDMLVRAVQHSQSS